MQKTILHILFILIFGFVSQSQEVKAESNTKASKESEKNKLKLREDVTDKTSIVKEKTILNLKREKDKDAYQSQELYNQKKYEEIKAQQQAKRYFQEQDDLLKPKTINEASKENETTLNEIYQKPKPVLSKSIHEDEMFEMIFIATPEDPNYETEDNNDRLRGPSQYDSRVEVYQLNPDIDWQFYMLLISKSVGMIVEKDKLIKISEESYQLDTSTTLQSQFNLCNDITFNNQSVVGVGTAFIYDSNSMLTASHVFQSTINNYAVVFGYEIINANGVTETIVNANDVFFPKKIAKRLDALDVAHFEVDRAFTDKVILQSETSRTLDVNTEIYMIGHPSGLPKKIAVNAGIIENKHPQYFYTSLDSFQGNSGSPVIDFKTNRVIGVLVSGETDYIYNGHCNEINSCAVPYCKGEKVIRIETILNQL